MLFTDLAETDRERIAEILHAHGVKTSEEISTLRRWSMACVALPTCGLAVAESERVLPGLIDEPRAGGGEARALAAKPSPCG